jgi:hypothetical protein
MRLTLLTVIALTPSLAAADELAQLPAPKSPDPAPKLTIVSPAMDAVMTGRKTRSPDDKFSDLDCMQDPKKLAIKLSAENWKVQPGGQGVLVVVDGVYATVVHDLSRPVMVADLEPYERDSFANSGTFAVQYPMYTCGEHWIAVMPTTADGHMLRVAPVVSWWRNVSSDIKYSQREEGPSDRHARLSLGLPVVNWPLIGSPYTGITWSQTEHEHRSGRVVANPKHVVLDWTIAPGESESDKSSDCALKIAAQDEMQSWNNATELPATGTVTLPAPYLDSALAIDSSNCGGMSPYFAMLWTKKPSALKTTFAWPKPGSAVAQDYWHSSEGHSQLKQHVKSQKQKCDKGEGDCQYGHTTGR